MANRFLCALPTNDSSNVTTFHVINNTISPIHTGFSGRIVSRRKRIIALNSMTLPSSFAAYSAIQAAPVCRGADLNSPAMDPLKADA